MITDQPTDPLPADVAMMIRGTALSAAATVWTGRGGTLREDQRGLIVQQAQVFEAYLRGDA